jgi:hypothetical protein
MSAACRAKSAYARATIAIRMLKTQKRLYRAFDDCLEMNDGHEVVREIRCRSREDPELVQALIRHRCDYWLKPEYMGEPDPPMQEIFL